MYFLIKIKFQSPKKLFCYNVKMFFYISSASLEKALLFCPTKQSVYQDKCFK
jgi:hypothetical protein